DLLAPTREVRLPELDPSVSGMGSPPRTASGLLQRASADRHGYERLKGNLADAFLELSRRRPVLLVIEDAQWIDLESLDLLAYLMKRVRDEEHERRRALPVALVVTARPASDDNQTRAVKEKLSASVDAIQEIALGVVREEHAGELVRNMLMLSRSDDIRGFVQGVLHGRSCSPLFLIQVLQLLLLGGELTRGQIDARGRWNGRWNLTPAPDALARLPLTIQDAIGERAARLSVETHALLQVAAVIGPHPELELVRAVLGLHRNQIRDLVDEAVEAGFLQFEQREVPPAPGPAEAILETTEEDPTVQDALRLGFTYDRYREVIEDAVAPDRRRELHRRVADAIECAHGGDIEWAVELARHADLGGDPRRAHRFAIAAAHHALKKGAIFHATDAMALALRAAECAGIDVPASEFELHADLCVQSGRFDEATTTYARCVERASVRADVLRILAKKSECAMRKGDFVRAAKPLEDLLASVGDPLPSSVVSYVPRLARDILRVLAIGSIPSLRRTEPASGPQAEVDALAARAWQKLGEVYVYVSPVKSLYALSRGAILAARLGPGPVTASCYAVVGYAASIAGLTSLARPWIQNALAWAHVQPAQDRAFALAMCVGESIFSGRVASELDLVHRTVDAAVQAQDVSRTSFGLVFAGAALRCAGHLDAARILANAVRRMGELSGHDQLASYGPMFAAFSDLAGGDVPIDPAVFRRAAESAARRGDVLMELVARIHEPLALARQDPDFIPSLDGLLALGERWLRGRYVTAAASATSALMAGLVYATVRAAPDLPQIERVVEIARRAEKVCAVQSHETPLFHGANAALQAWLGRTVEAEWALERCARALETTRYFYARNLIDALLQEARPGWRHRAALKLPANDVPAEAAESMKARLTHQLEGLAV
ncbi:MAG: hypothetical protein WBV82_17975, partial [Myxococcaceae bacterium]